MFAVLAVASLVIAAGPFSFNSTHLLILAAGLAVVSATLLLTRPQPIDSAGNHLALASTYVGTCAAMVAFSPTTSAAASAIMFAGPLVAMRLVDRREITGHLMLATIFVLAPVAYAHETTPSWIGMATIVTGVWVLGGCCVLVFETAEKQGEELEQLMRRDPLTGAGNQRMFSEELARALRRHQRTRRPLSLVAINLDGFRQINDTLGHAAGDELLQRVVKALASTVQQQGVVFRTGDDEFNILLPGVASEATQDTVSAVRVALATCGVTAGVGVASFPRDAVHDKVLRSVAEQRLAEDRASSGGGPVAAPTSPLRVMRNDEADR